MIISIDSIRDIIFMIVCVCNPFNDKKVQEHLRSSEGSVRMSEVYSACSDGQKPNCCSCLETLKDMVKSHNRTRTTSAV